MILFSKSPGLFVSLILVWIGLSQCHDSIDTPGYLDKNLSDITYHPVPYSPVIPSTFPALEQPTDNLMTVDGIRLGRKLFYDPILSIDSTISCSTCHIQAGSFTDDLPFSKGVDGNTPRSSISLLDVGFHYNRLFWDGRSPSLEDQAIHPVENSIEMGESWDHIEIKLKRHPEYPIDFRKAFGIVNTSMITRDLVVKAIAQFERTIISGGNSKYDRFIRGETFLNDNETTGYLMFFNIDRTLPDAQCGHCHNAPLFGGDAYFNNGLQESADFYGFADPGLGAIDSIPSHNGLFKTPTLRNLVFTAPYMHDGRFKTIEEVVEHYSSGGKNSPNKSPFLNAIHLTPSQKSDLISFILTLTDSSVISNHALENPF